MFNSDLYQVIPKKQPNFVRIGTILFAFMVVALLFVMIYSDFEYLTPVYLIAIALLLMSSFVELYVWRVQWESLAANTSLEIDPPNRSLFKKLTLRGSRHGHKTVISTFSRGSGRNRQYYTQIMIQFPFTVENSFSITKKGLFNSGGERIDIEEIDNLCVIKTTDPHMVHAVFQATRQRQGLVDLVSQAKRMNLTVANDRLTYYERDRILDTVYLAAVHDFLHKVGEAVRHQTQYSFGD